jgi:class 3 adenylate cyclase/tetratricopeptide (TPR) repeat protein
MRCVHCQGENETAARFCKDCGARLEQSCPTCGEPVTPGKNFCRSCGASLTADANLATRFTSPENYTPKYLAEQIFTSKSALEGERKQVAVLFADLKGSMELLADRDPEEARKILDPVLERMMEAVHRYEGIVNQVMGDGIMALFGAPLAREDHAVRACYAALRMQEAVKTYADDMRRAEGVPIRIRIGLNSGEVVVRSIGSDLHMDYTAVGQMTNLAARMEQMADPGTILMTSSTLRLAEGFVQVQPLGPVSVKGVPAPVETFSLTGATAVRSRLQAAAARGLTRFVGREAETGVLLKALERARSGRGQVVAVVGEPGAGKSRLVWEFTHSDHTQGCLVLEASSVSYGKASTYLPVIDLLKGYFQLEPRDDARKIREKVTGKLLSLDRALESCLTPICWLFDLPTWEPEWERLAAAVRRQRLRDSIRRVLLSESQVQPLVMIFEDLHWIDGETQTLLDSIVEGLLPGVRVLLFVSYRPEYTHGWGSKTYYSQARLDALPSTTAAKLLQALLGPDSSVAALMPMLINHAEGNPFFLEESVRSLVESQILSGARGAHRLARPIGALDIPASVQAILAARIDRLSQDDKRLLQVASVVGKDVPVALLQAIAELPDEALRDGLNRLQATEFLYETGLFPDLEYSFKHALTHDVAYAGLLHERRRALHARATAAIEVVFADRLDDHIDRLAHHAFEGHRWDAALMYARRAGQRAFARYANREAVTFLEQALVALGHLPETAEIREQAFELRLTLRRALNVLTEFPASLHHAQEARKLAERLGDPRKLAQALAFEANTLYTMDDFEGSLRVGRSAADEARRIGDAVLGAYAAATVGRALAVVGRYADAVSELIPPIVALPKARALDRAGLPFVPSVFARCQLAAALMEQGLFDDAARHVDDALIITRAVDEADAFFWVRYSIGRILVARGMFSAAISPLERAREIASSHNFPVYYRMTNPLLAYARALTGAPGQGLPALRAATDGCREKHQTRNLTPALLHLAEVAVYAGDEPEARAASAEALDLARRLGMRGYEASALRIRGEAWRLASVWPAAADAYASSLGIADSLGMRPLVAHCHLALGKLYGRVGKCDDASEHLTTAATMYREMGMGFWLDQAEAELKPGRP